MKKSRALAKTAQAQTDIAARIVNVERNIELIMQHLGITPLPEPVFIEGLEMVEASGDELSNEEESEETTTLDDVPPDEVVEETASKRKK